MGDKGRNGIADQPPKGSHFRPRARRARGRKWGPAGGWSAIPFLPLSPMQKFHFIISIFPEIIIPEKKILKIFRTSWSEISLQTGPQNNFGPVQGLDFIKKNIYLKEVRLELGTS